MREELVGQLRGDRRAIDPLAARADLSQFWDEHKQKHPEHTVRLSTINLVVVCPAPEQLPGVADDLEALCRTHPARVFLLAIDSSASGPMEGWLSLACHQDHVCQEQISIYAPGETAMALPSLVSPLFRPDNPDFLWWRGAPRFGEPLWKRLVDLADRIVVNTSKGPDLLAPLLAEVRDPYRQEQGFSDLEWARMARWRHLVAAMFDRPEGLEQLRRIHRVEVGFAPGPHGSRSAALYMGGWLAARLGYRVASPLKEGCAVWKAPDGREVEFALAMIEGDARVAGKVLHVNLCGDGCTFRVHRKRDNPEVFVTHVQGARSEHPDLDRFIRFMERQRLMGCELEIVGRQRLFEQALEATVELEARLVPAA
ncbi:MAG: glucose-6-phosphate dehydrogenase assembly protein OpcA [Candidatus Eremiobacterota bacterium]